MFSWLFRKKDPLAQERALARANLRGYPEFAPPHRENANNLTQTEAVENFEFLMQQKEQRLAAFGAFLAKFGVSAGLDDGSIRAVSTWSSRFAGALAEDLRSTRAELAFFHFAEPWRDELQGLNAILDFGLFFGEALIARNSKFAWKLRSGPFMTPPHAHTGFVFIRKNGKYVMPIEHTYTRCNAVFQEMPARKYGVNTWTREEDFSMTVKTWAEDP